jgi:hypothetical protein
MSKKSHGAVAFVTRPNNVGPYVPGGVVGAIMEFPGAGPAQGEALITSVALEIDTATFVAGMAGFRLYLYGAIPPSAFTDAVVWDLLLAADRAAYLGFVDLGTPADLGSTLYVESNMVNKQITMPGNPAGTLWGYLVTVAGFIPAAQIVHKVTIHTVDLDT